MIFVTVGSTPYPFDRLVAAFDGTSITEEIVIQCGASKLRPELATCLAFVPPDEIRHHMAAARAVVCHAGVGSVSEALRAGKRPFVVARRRHLGENVDDHQLAFAWRLQDGGLARVLHDLPGELHRALAAPTDAVPPYAAPDPRLVAAIRGFIALRRGESIASS
jgi:UDP-N-acetylglucosamine transferase subunit ALG13